MLLTMAILVALASTYVEVKLVHGAKWLDTLYTKGAYGIDGVYFNTAGSFIISWFMGMMFGAQGVTVFVAGVISTFLSQAYFSTENFTKARGWSVAGAKAKAHSTLNRAQQAKDSTVKVYQDFRQPIRDMLTILKGIFTVITMPFVLARKWSAAYSARRSV